MKVPQNIFSLINTVVKFNDRIEESEIDLDPNMIGKIINIIDKHDGLFEFCINTSAYDEHNDKCMKSNYYDRNGNPCLTARQADMWPNNGIHSVYFDFETDLPFEILESEMTDTDYLNFIAVHLISITNTYEYTSYKFIDLNGDECEYAMSRFDKNGESISYPNILKAAINLAIKDGHFVE